MKDQAQTVEYSILFCPYAIGISAKPSASVAEIVSQALTELAKQAETLASSLPPETSARQEMPKMAELNLDYAATPFHAIRLLGVREKDGQLVKLQ